MKRILIILFVLLISQVVFAQTKVDEYGKLISDDEGSRLFGVSQEFSKNKDSKIYVLINKEKKMPLGRFLRYFYGLERWLILMEIPKESIVMIAGEEKDKQLTQIWFVRSNEKPPVFEQISLKDKLNEKVREKMLFDENCIDCDESPFIKLGIFGEGLDYLASVLKANPKSLVTIHLINSEMVIKNRKKFMSDISDSLLNDYKVKKNQLYSFLFLKGSDALVRFYIFPKPVKIKKN